MVGRDIEKDFVWFAYSMRFWKPNLKFNIYDVRPILYNIPKFQWK